MSYDPSPAEPPDEFDRDYQPRDWPADAGSYPPVPRPRTHHEAAQPPPDPLDDAHRRARRPDELTLRVAGRAVSAGYAAPAGARSTPSQSRASTAAMTAAATFWYVLGCIALGSMYFAKVPCKKALEEAGLATMTSAERVWYVLGCVPFGAFYFCKLPVKKALTETRGW